MAKNLPQVISDLKNGKGVFVGSPLFVREDGSVVDVNEREQFPASALGKAAYDEFEGLSAPSEVTAEAESVSASAISTHNSDAAAHSGLFGAVDARMFNRRLPVKSLRPTPKYIAPTDNPSAWTAGNLTLSADTDRCLAGGATAPQSLRVTCGSNGTAHLDISSADFSSHGMVVGFFIHQGTAGATDWKKLQKIDIDFYSGGFTDTDHRLRINIYNYGDDTIVDRIHHYGWNFIGVVPERDYSANGISFNAAAVTRIRINTVNVSSSTPSFSVSYMSMMPLLSKGGVVNIIDNFANGVYQMAAYAATKGVKLSLSVVPSFVGTSGYATLQQIRECQDMGHFIFNHTYDHASFTYPTPLTEAQVLAEYRLAYKWMSDNGLSYGASVLSVPGAYFNNIPFDLLYPITDGIFHSWSRALTGALWVPYYPATRMIPQTTIDGTSTGSISALIAATNAGTYKAIAVNGYHGTYWTADNGAAWKSYIDSISALGTVNFYGLDDVICGNISIV